MQDPTISNTQNQGAPAAVPGFPSINTPGVTPVAPVASVSPNPVSTPNASIPGVTPPSSSPVPVSTTPSVNPPSVQPGIDVSLQTPSSGVVPGASAKPAEEKKPVEEKRETAKSGQPEVKKVNIEKVVSSWTGIPITKLTEDEGAKLLNLEKRIHQRLIDQEEAVTAVAEAVRRGRIGLAAANRPIASFIFLGPSGTGKTELAKTLAEILFGKDDALVRLDMSEYMEKHEVAKLIGAPPGYVGYEEGGQLTEAVRAKPYSIVLLDEVEKAHPDVFNILLQLLEDGRLTDNKGNTISFKNTIVICTSNIGSALITQKLGEKDGKPQSEESFDKEFAELTTLVSGELHKFFRPELLNRFDDIVIFKPLRRQDMAAIAKLGIEKTSSLLKEQDVKLQISDKALAQLALEGYDPIYGARPLRRLIQTSIENPIAVLIIAKTFIAGDTIMIDYDTTKADYSFHKATPEEVASGKKKAEEEKIRKQNEVEGKTSVADLNTKKPQAGQSAPSQNVSPSMQNPNVGPTSATAPAPVQGGSVPNTKPIQPLNPNIPKNPSNGIAGGAPTPPVPPSTNTS